MPGIIRAAKELSGAFLFQRGACEMTAWVIESTSLNFEETP